MGIKHILNEMVKDGEWKFRIVKFIILGLLLLYFSFAVQMAFSFPNVDAVKFLYTYVGVILISATDSYGAYMETLNLLLLMGYLFQLLFGYLLSKSLYRKLV